LQKQQQEEFQKKQQQEEEAKKRALQKAALQQELATDGDPTPAKKKQKRYKMVDNPCQHLDGGSTVIVGAGIVGMCIARQLAGTTRATNTAHKVSSKHY
jgi:hypothetical protein